MARDAELDRLKVAQDVAFQRKQNAYQAQQTAWEKLSSARDEMNRAYEAKQRAYYTQDQAWQYYQSVKSHNGPRIDWLNSQQESAFQNMKQAFDNASSAYERRDGASASMYAAEGHRYKEESKTYVCERRRLVEEIRSARDKFQECKPAFQDAKDYFSSAKDTFNSAKAEHKRAQAEFKKAKAEFDDCVKAFKARLDELKSASQKRREDKKSIAEKAGVPSQYRDNVWISTDSNGNTNIYFGGFGKPDGPGHGHYVMDQHGTVIYRRGPSEPHGTQNFTNKPGGALYDRRIRRDMLPLGLGNRDNDTNDRSGVFYDRRRQIDLHVTQYYKDNYRVSWDTDGKSNKNYHWTNQSLPSSHPDSHIPPEDAR